MTTYTIQTTNEDLANNYSGFGEWEIASHGATETYTVTIPVGQMAAFEQLLNTDNSVLSYTETAEQLAAEYAADDQWQQEGDDEA